MSDITTRAEHLQWCKDRAEEYLKEGEYVTAWSSFVSDMRKHEETAEHGALVLGMQLLMSGHHKSVDDMRKFIQGFN